MDVFMKNSLKKLFFSNIYSSYLSIIIFFLLSLFFVDRLFLIVCLATIWAGLSDTYTVAGSILAVIFIHYKKSNMLFLLLFIFSMVLTYKVGKMRELLQIQTSVITYALNAFQHFFSMSILACVVMLIKIKFTRKVS